MIALPIAIFVLIGFIQFISNYIFNINNDTSNPLLMFINIVLWIISVGNIVLLFIIPLWIVLIVNELQGKIRTKTNAIVLAFFLGYWSWVYTYEKTKKLFWINLVLTVMTIGIWAFFAWIWAIIYYSVKSYKYYEDYYVNLPVPKNTLNQ